MARLPRAIIVVAALVVVLSACAAHDDAVKASAQPAPALSVDSLIVSVEDVQRITNFDDLTSDPQFDVRQPGKLDADSPPPCPVVFDQQATFGGGWTQFRSVQYSGAANKGVTQAVGIYPDDQSARAAFDRLATSLTQCSSRHAEGIDYTIKKSDPATLEVCFAEVCKVAFGVKSSVLIDVSVQQFPTTAEQIAHTVLQTIAGRINAT